MAQQLARKTRVKKTMLVTLLVATIVGCSQSPQERATTFLRKRFPTSTISGMTVTEDGTVVCGEIESSSDPARVFFVDLAQGRTRVLDDMDVTTNSFLDACQIKHGTAKEMDFLSRWRELNANWKQYHEANAAQESADRERQRLKKWAHENEAGLRALQQATDEIQAGKR